jgi:hypothetical protein
MNCADACADIEQRRISHAGCLEGSTNGVDEQARRASRTAAVQSPQLSLRFGIVEDLFDSSALSAYHATVSVFVVNRARDR